MADNFSDTAFDYRFMGFKRYGHYSFDYKTNRLGYNTALQTDRQNRKNNNEREKEQMKKVKRILAVILLIFVLCFVGYTVHTCSRINGNATEQIQTVGGDYFE